jgi:hypothetical protein
MGVFFTRLPNAVVLGVDREFFEVLAPGGIVQDERCQPELAKFRKAYTGSPLCHDDSQLRLAAIESPLLVFVSVQ